MSDFQTLAADLATRTHRSNDLAVAKDCVVQTLRQMRGRRVDWGEGTFAFTTETDVNEYPFGAYPRIPGGIMSLLSVQTSYDGLAGAVLQPGTLKTQTNLTGTISDVQDSAEKPDDDYLDPTTAATWTMEVVWNDTLTRPLKPGQLYGAGGQIMRVAMYNEGTNRTVTWTVKEGATTVATDSWTVNSTSAAVYEAAWDAAKLSTLNPAAGQIALETTDASSSGDVHTGAVQWFTYTRDEERTATGGQRDVEVLTQAEIQEYIGGRVTVTRAVPRFCSVFNNRLWLYPTPNSAYRINIHYQKDSTRDSTTNAEITSSSTTETNEWFTTGYAETLTRALRLYHATRSQDPTAMNLVSGIIVEQENANDLAYELGVFDSPPRGYLP